MGIEAEEIEEEKEEIEEEKEEKDEEEKNKKEKEEKATKKQKESVPQKKKKEESESPKKIEIKAVQSRKQEPSQTLGEQKPAPQKETPAEWFEPEGELAVDVYQTDEEIVIQSTVAGVKPEDIDINIENDVVTISGERSNTTADTNKNYYYQECFWGAFSRQIILPEEVDASRAEAKIKDGIFTLRLPKFSRQKVRKIKVRF